MGSEENIKKKLNANEIGCHLITKEQSKFIPGQTHVKLNRVTHCRNMIHTFIT